MHAIKNSLVMQFFLAVLFYSPIFLHSEITRTFECNKNNQLIKEVRADGLYLVYAYDVHGNVLQELSSGGNSVDYVYDPFHCLNIISRL